VPTPRQAQAENLGCGAVRDPVGAGVVVVLAPVVDLAREPLDLGAGLLLLTIVALALGPAAPWEIHWVGRGLEGILGFDLSDSAVQHPLVLGPVFEKFSVLAPTWLAIVLPAYALITAALVWVVLRPPVRRAPVWVSGTMVAPSLVQYTPAAYSNPIRVVLRGPYGFTRRLHGNERAGSRTHEPLALESRVVPAFEEYLYDPATRFALRFSEQARRLQSGRLGAYLLYMLLLLLVILALIPAVRS